MNAALLEAYGLPLRMAQVPDPEPAPADAVVRVRACGICRSDWHVWAGDWRWRLDVSFPHVLGHEFAGEVVAVGRGVSRVRAGDRVTVPFHLSCHTCRFCREGRSNICERYSAIGFHVPGAFAELVRIPDADANLVALPEGVAFEAAAALGCRFGSAHHGLERAGVRDGEHVLVIGCGGVGLSAIHLAAAMGARVIAVDTSERTLVHARRAGATEAMWLDPADATALAALIVERTGGGADLTVDAVGTESALGLALGVLRPGGRHLQLGLTGAAERGHVSVHLDRIVKSELTIVGAVGAPRDAFARLVAMVGDGRVRPGDLVSEVVGLEDVSDVLRDMSSFARAGMVLWATG